MRHWDVMNQEVISTVYICYTWCDEPTLEYGSRSLGKFIPRLLICGISNGRHIAARRHPNELIANDDWRRVTEFNAVMRDWYGNVQRDSWCRYFYRFYAGLWEYKINYPHEQCQKVVLTCWKKIMPLYSFFISAKMWTMSTVWMTTIEW